MATMVAPNLCSAPSSKLGSSSSAGNIFVGLRPQVSTASDWSKNTVQNVSRITCMQTLNPLTNHRFETLSYVPPLSSDSIAKEIDYMLSKNWIPCLEFDKGGSITRESSRIPGYYDGRYWTLWKLPMFGCNDPAQVLREIDECKKTYPDCYIRILGFDNKKQVQCVSFIVHRPT